MYSHCHRTRKAIHKLNIIGLAILIALAICALLASCSTFSGSLTVPTDYGSAVIRTGGGKTSVDLELPRR